ncbi:MAG: histidine phosphatase family protein, partial [Vicingaceae bacterium]
MADSSKNKKLYIIRHAKSAWNSPTLKDFDRPLNDRGLNDAPSMGRRLSERKILPDLIIASEANRAQTTARLIAKELNYPESDIQFTKDIYHASIKKMIQIINQIDNQYNTVFLFGHNPTFTELAEYLTDEAYGTLPTCG